MNKTVELVNKWAAFEEKYPKADLEDFCRYYLTSEKEKSDQGKLFGGSSPPRVKTTLIRLIVSIERLYGIYAKNALEGIKIKQFEEFILLSTIHQRKEPRKTEAIYYSWNELSTGLNLLNNLKDQGYITEQEDPNDKRSKRVKLTPEGMVILRSCYDRLAQLSEMMFAEMEDEDALLCIQLLKNVEIKFSGLWQQHKDKSFEEIAAAMVAEKDKVSISQIKSQDEKDK